MDPSAVLGQLTDGYLKLPLIQKIIFPLLIIGSVVGIIFVSKWANSPDYVVLYSDLQPADASAVVEKLKSQKIKYDFSHTFGKYDSNHRIIIKQLYEC